MGQNNGFLFIGFSFQIRILNAAPNPSHTTRIWGNASVTLQLLDNTLYDIPIKTKLTELHDTHWNAR